MIDQTPVAPTVAVGVVVLHGDSVLLIQRGKEPNKGAWSIPGGKQEVGETVKACGRREVREETGVIIEDLQLLDCLDLMEKSADGKVTRHYTLIDYCTTINSFQTPTAGDDALKAEFVPLQQAIERVKWQETKRIIADAAQLVGLDNW